MTKTITVYSLPTVAVTGIPAICVGNTATLSANGAVSYSWNTTSTNTLISVSPLINTSYTVTGTDINGCQTTVVKTITVNALPVLTVSSTTAMVCIGGTVALTPAGATTYTYMSVNGTTNNNTFTVTANTTYTILGTNANGCQGVMTTTVGVNASPLVTIAGNSTLCAGQTTTLTASGATTYSWSNGATGSSFVIAPLAGYNYMVTGTDANGCKGNASTSFSVNPLPIITAATNNTLICVGESATLTASGANSYAWTGNGANASIVVTPSTNTTYTVQGLNAANCSAMATIMQEVSECTGLESRSSASGSVVVFPNPNNGAFTIAINRSGNFTVEVINALGQPVYVGSLNSGANKLDLHLNKGIYFYSVSDRTSVISPGKLIVE
jgi:hypothetical protein